MWGATLVILAPLLALLWTLLLLDLAERQQEIKDDQEDRIYNVTQISAQALHNLLIAADQTLIDLGDRWSKNPHEFVDEVRRRRNSFALGIDFHISVIGPDGRLRFSTMNAGATGMDLSATAHFTRPRDASLGRMFLGAAYFAAEAQRWALPFSRRLPSGADGSFSGVIVFWVPPDFVKRIYKTASLKPQSVFALLELSTGQILSRHLKARDTTPQHEQASADNPMQSTAALEPHRPKPGDNLGPAALERARLWPDTGVGQWHFSLDSVNRTYAWHKYPSLSIALVAGEPARYMQHTLDLLHHRYLLTGGFITLLLGLATVGLLGSSRGRAQTAISRGLQLTRLASQQAELLRSRNQLRQLSQHLATVRENERFRIAQDIHDELGQRLTVLRMGAAQLMARLQAAQAAAASQSAALPTADFTQFQPALRILKSQLDDTIAVVRQITEDLRPSALSVGLGTAIESLCDEFQASLGKPCRLNNHLPPTLYLPTETATVAYRIVQEGLTNITRHAQAEQLEITLETQGPWLQVSLRDDGIGFDPNPEHAPQPPSGFGLLGMRERVQGIGGQVSVHSSVGQGCHVQARLPLHTPPPAAAPAPPRTGTRTARPARPRTPHPTQSAPTPTMPIPDSARPVPPAPQLAGQRSTTRSDTRVLLADDHGMMRAGLSSIINSAPGLCVTAQAQDGPGTLAQLASQTFDLLMLDLSMPPPSGVELIALVRQRHPQQRILVVTMHNNARIARAAIDAGASGYITKDNDPDVLIQAVRQVAAGGRFIEPRLMEAMLFAAPPSPQNRLTPRETEVMRRVSAGQSHGEIARAFFLSEKAISTHKANLMGKLGLRSMADLVRYATEHLPGTETTPNLSLSSALLQPGL